jgi:hypothetical protein
LLARPVILPLCHTFALCALVVDDPFLKVMRRPARVQGNRVPSPTKPADAASDIPGPQHPACGFCGKTGHDDDLCSKRLLFVQSQRRQPMATPVPPPSSSKRARSAADKICIGIADGL